MTVVVLPANPPQYVRELMCTLGCRIVEDPALPRPIAWRIHDGETERAAWAGYRRDSRACGL